MSLLSIVVADDDCDCLDLIQGFLIEEGYDQVLCVQESEVFELVLLEQPSLVLLQVNSVPVGVGWETLERLRRHPDTIHIPVIVCSTEPHMLRARTTWLAAMHCDTLEKPFDLDALLAKVRAILGPPNQAAAYPQRSRGG